MADVAKRLAGPALLTNAAATVYTTPGATTTIIRNIHVANETGTAATVTLSIGADAAGKRFWYQLNVPANGAIDWSGFQVLAAAEVVQAYSGTASALTLTMSGVEAS